MAITLDDLLNPQTVQELFQTLIGYYQANGFPVQSWQPGGVERTRAMAISTATADVSSNYVPAITAGGFLDYAEQLTNGWLELLAAQNFLVNVNEASFTVGNITLTAATGAGPYTFAAGDLVAVFAASGNRYINNEGGTLTLSGTLEVSFTAEQPGAAYNDPSSSGAISLVSPLPGVTLTNPAGDYTDVAHVGSGTGTLTLGGSPVGNHQVIVQINSTGAAGVATWSYSLDGQPFVSEGAASSVTDLAGTGIDITLVDGVSGTSFVLDDTYLFNTPGSWITTQGADKETNANLAQRCRARWSSLSPIPVSNFYYLLATSTPDVGSQVTQVIVVPDAVINDKVNIVCAGPEGALPVDTIAAIQEYINPRVPGTEFPVVVSPSVDPVVLAATVTVQASLLTPAQNGIQTALVNYVNGVGINGTVRIASIIELVMEVTGVVDIASVTINGVAANLVLGDSSTFVIADLTLPLSFTYVTV